MHKVLSTFWFRSAILWYTECDILPQSHLWFVDAILYEKSFGEDALPGWEIAEALENRDMNILLMANHGVLVTSKSLAESFDAMVSLEHAAKIQIQLRISRFNFSFLSSSLSLSMNWKNRVILRLSRQENQ